MNARYRTEGLVFAREDRLDDSRVFWIFTKEFGRLELFAKAIRKIDSKLKGGIELFSVSSLEFIQGKNKKTLTDASFILRLGAIKRDPEKMASAVSMAQMIDEFIKGQQPDERLFSFLITSFTELAELKKSDRQALELLRIAFFWKLMVLLGFGPQLHQCAVCGKLLAPDGLSFSPRDGGLVCKTCNLSKKRGTPIGVDAAKLLRMCAADDHKTLLQVRLPAHLYGQVRAVSQQYYMAILQSYTFDDTKVASVL